MEMAKEIKQMKAEFGKDQKDLFYEIRELKEEIKIQKKKVIVWEEYVSFIRSGFEKVKKENKTIKNQLEVLKADKNRFTKKMFVMEENSKQAKIKLNQIENLMEDNNIEIQGVPDCCNEDFEVSRSKNREASGRKIRRLRTTDAESNQEKKEGKRMYYLILVIFKSREQKF